MEMTRKQRNKIYTVVMGAMSLAVGTCLVVDAQSARNYAREAAYRQAESKEARLIETNKSYSPQNMDQRIAEVESTVRDTALTELGIGLLALANAGLAGASILAKLNE